MKTTKTMSDAELLDEGVIYHCMMRQDGGYFHPRLGVFISHAQYARLTEASR